MQHGLGGQPTAVEAVDVDRVDVSAVAGKHDLPLGGDCQVGDGEVESRVWRDQGPQVDALLNGEDIDRSVFGSGNGQVEVNIEGHAGDRFVVAAQHLQDDDPSFRVFSRLGLPHYATQMKWYPCHFLTPRLKPYPSSPESGLPCHLATSILNPTTVAFGVV